MTVDLRKCAPGDELRLRDGNSARYHGASEGPKAAKWPHLVVDADGTVSSHGDDGSFWGGGAFCGWDVTEVVTGRGAMKETRQICSRCGACAAHVDDRGDGACRHCGATGILTQESDGPGHPWTDGGREPKKPEHLTEKGFPKQNRNPIFAEWYGHAGCDCYKIDLPWSRYGRHTVVLCACAEGPEHAKRVAGRVLAEHLGHALDAPPAEARDGGDGTRKITPGAAGATDREAASAELGSAVYAAAILLERLEDAGKVRGNGHHMAQSVAAFATGLLAERWIADPPR